MIRKALLVLVLALILVFLGSWIAGSLLLSRPRDRGPADLRPAAGIEEVGFAASDGVKLRGWWWPGRDPERAVILLHGWRADRLQMLPRARWLHEYGYSVFLFDFRGCGASEGRTTLGFDERRDVEAAIDLLRERQKVKETILIGESQGAAAAVMAVDHWEGVKGAVLELLFDRFENAVRERVRRLAGPLEPAVSPLLLWQVHPRLGFSPDDLSPIDSLRRARCPLLLGFGARDSTITPRAAASLFGAAPPPATIWILQQAGHTDLFRFDRKAYEEKVGSFLGETLGPPDKGCKG